MTLIFATQNQNKVREIREMLGDKFDIKSLADVGHFEDIEETGNTIEENSKIKADFVFEKFGEACFADDSGLEIDTLEGRPGVLSARYAGPQKSDDENMSKVLKELQTTSDRGGQFKTVISLVLKDKKFIQFPGIIRGSIALEPKGSLGFGYDPIFIPEGYDLTFAQVPAKTKNKISHRAIAVQQLVSYLSGLSDSKANSSK